MQKANPLRRARSCRPSHLRGMWMSSRIDHVPCDAHHFGVDGHPTSPVATRQGTSTELAAAAHDATRRNRVESKAQRDSAESRRIGPATSCRSESTSRRSRGPRPSSTRRTCLNDNAAAMPALVTPVGAWSSSNCGRRTPCAERRATRPLVVVQHGARASAPALAPVRERALQTTFGGSDDDRERRRRVLLLGEGAVLVHRLARPLAAELDEDEQQPMHDTGRDARCSFDRRASSRSGVTSARETQSSALAPRSCPPSRRSERCRPT